MKIPFNKKRSKTHLNRKNYFLNYFAYLIKTHPKIYKLKFIISYLLMNQND